jgi:nucleoside-diphosphate-sugar epimerase
VAERVLVTGVLGCLGAWVARCVLDDGDEVVGYDLGDARHRIELVLGDDVDRLEIVKGDITELAAVERALDEHEITRVVHLAALQVPFCRENPVLGAQVNVTGTVNVFEAAKRQGLATTIAYASSAAVYDRQGAIAPRTLYGVYKVADEGIARVYAEESDVASVGLRPFTVYGPGRDQGLTAGPTLAIAAAVRGEPYHIGFGGRTQFHYAPDVARSFIRAARSAPGGAQALSIGGPATTIADFVALVAGEVTGAEITYDDAPLPFPDELPGPWFDAPLTPLEEGLRETAAILRSVV